MFSFTLLCMYGVEGYGRYDDVAIVGKSVRVIDRASPYALAFPHPPPSVGRGAVKYPN